MKKEMRCAVFTGQRAVELQRFPIPEVDDDKILVKIEACGICTWNSVFTGSINTDYPLIGGHEAAGTNRGNRKGCARRLGGWTKSYCRCNASLSFLLFL